MSIFSKLRRRYGHGFFGGSVWQVSLQVKSPGRPNLAHQLEYTVKAGGKEDAVKQARTQAVKDGNTVVSVVGAAQRPG